MDATTINLAFTIRARDSAREGDRAMLPRPTRLIALFLIAASLTFPAFAQPLADRLPADTLLYIGWRGADSLGPGFAGSHLKAILDASDFSQLINEFLPAVFQRIAQEDRDAAEVLPIMATIGRPMWKHPSALYFGGLDMQGPEPFPRLAMLCDAGADAPQLLQTLKDLVAKAQQGGGPPIAVKEANGLVMVTLGNVPASLGQPAGASSLTAEKGFKDAMAQVGKDPSIAFYVNFESIIALADQCVAQQGPPEAKQMWPKIRDNLGLGGLKRILYTGGFDGKDWMDTAFVAAPAPRTGLMKLGEAAPLPADALKVAPKTSTYAAAGRFNLGGLVAAIREGIGQFDPQAQAQVDQVFAQVSQALGFDVQKDFLAALGDQWVVYTDPNTGGYGLVGTVLVNKLADPAKFEQSASRLEQFLNQLIASQMQQEKEKVTISFQTRTVGGVALHYLAVPLVTPTWAVKDGNLYFALYPQSVIGAAEFAASGKPSVLQNELFISLRKRLGVDNAAGIAFYDLPRMAPTTYGEWVALSRLVGFGDLFGVKSPLLLMPPMDKLMAELDAAGAVSWTDDAGFHLKSVSPFPGSTALAADPVTAYMSGAGPAIMASLLLPAVSKARESANRVKSISNLRQIGIGCLMYANDNRGSNPPDLGAIIKSEYVTPDVFISPLSGQQLPPEVSRMTRDQQAQWANEHSDYVYLGKGKKSSQIKADEVLAYEKLELGQMHGGVNILYGDGHVEWVPISEAQRQVGAPKAPGQ
jgi:prepilin-type processing-associated H-X9-DG protein